MITFLRDQLRTIGYRHFIWVLLGAFILGSVYMPSIFRGSFEDLWVLKINGEKIGYKGFVGEVEQKRSLIEAIRMQYGPYTEMLLHAYGLSSDPKDMAYHEIVRNTLLKQSLSHMNIHCDGVYVKQLLGDQKFLREEFGDYIGGIIVNGHHMDSKHFCSLLKRVGLTTEELEGKIELAVQKKVFRDFILSSVVVPSFDIESHLRVAASEKKIGILSIPRSVVKKQPGVSGTQSNLQEYFKQQNELGKRYWMPEQRSGIVLTLMPSMYAITVTDDAIKEYYHANAVTQFLVSPAEVQVRRILFAVTPESVDKEEKLQLAQKIKSELLKNHERFSEYAHTYSDDVTTKSNGGLVPAFKKGERGDKSFEQAAFMLNEPGAISNVVETASGYEILQLVSKKERVVKSLEEVRSTIVHELSMQEFKKKVASDCQQYLERSQDLYDVLKSKGASEKAIGLASLDNANGFVKKLFEISLGSVGTSFTGDTAAIVFLKEVVKPFEQPFAAVAERVADDYRNEQINNRLAEYQKDIKNMLKSTSLDLVVKNFDGAFYEELTVSEATKADSAKSVENKISVSELLSLEKIGSCAFTTNETGLTVASVLAIKEAGSVPSESPEIKRFQTERSHCVLEGFVASLYKNAKIETNEIVFSKC